MIENVSWSSCKVPVILVIFKWNLNFYDGFFKNTQIPSFVKICPVGAELFNVDRQTDRHTDMKKLTVSFAILWTHLKDRQWNQTVRTCAWSKRKSSYTRKMITQAIHFFFLHSYHASCLLSKFFITNSCARKISLKGVIKFMLKLLQHVSVWSPSSGSILHELAKVTLLKKLIKIHHCG